MSHHISHEELFCEIETTFSAAGFTYVADDCTE
ncbi:hypothetical protein MSIMFI_02556 [Mycobacterium simulans]|nr:hypothetical protein MSIMFI_02556 [Mycobacterium simulans]